MATSKDRNLKLVITGDTKDVEKKLEVVKTRADRMGVALANSVIAFAEEGNKAIATLTFMDEKLKKLERFAAGTKRATGGKKDQVIFTDNSEEQARTASKKEGELLRIKKQAATARLRLAKETNAEILKTTKDTAIAQKAIAINGANSRLGIKAAAALKEKEIFRTLQEELKRIAKRTEAGTLVGAAANASKIKAQKRAQRDLNKVYQTTAALLDKLPKRFSKINDGHKTWIRHVTEIVGVYRLVNFGINTVINSIKAIPKIGIELQTTKAVLESTLGSSAASAEAFRFLSFEAERAGKSILGVRENFRNLSASMTLAGEETSTVLKVFTNLNTVSTALHLTSEKTQNVFLAIAQIFNKTKVQSEELVKQLGNLLPGAFASFARSMEISTRDLTKQLQLGLVDSSKVPKFLEQLSKDFAAAFVIAEKGLQASTERLQTSFIKLGEAIFSVIERPLLATVDTLTKLGKFLTETVKGTKELASNLEVFLAPAIGLVVGGLTAWALQATYAATATAALTASAIGFSGVGAVLVSTLGSMGAALSILIKPVAIIAGLTGIAFAMANINKEGKSAAKSARNFFKSVEEQAKLAAKDPVAFNFEVKVSEDASVKALTENLDLSKTRLETVKKKLAELRGESNNTKQGLLGKVESFVNVNILSDYTNFLEEEKVLLSDIAKGNAQLATAREVATGKIKEQMEKEKLLSEERKKSLLLIKKQALLAKQKEGNAKLKAERDYQQSLQQTHLILLKLQAGEDPAKKQAARDAEIEFQNKLALAKIRSADAGAKRELEVIKEIRLQKSASARAEEEKKIAEIAFQTKLSNITKERTSELSKLFAREAIINAKKNAGLITELQAFRQIKDNKREIIRLEEELLTKQQILSEVNPTKELQEGITKTVLKIQQLKIELAGLKPPLTELEKLGKRIETSLTASLGNAFAGFIKGTKSAGEAMRDFASSVLDSVAKIAANNLAKQIIGGLVGAFSPGAGAAYGSGVSGGNSAGFSNLIATAFQAKGAVNTGMSEASGSILTKPTYFPNAKPTAFASGGVVAGEAGAEAVLPLKRNSQGKLGVSVANYPKTGSNFSSGVVIENINITVTSDKEDSPGDTGEKIAIALMKKIAKQEIYSANRPGNALNKTTVFG